MPQKLITSKEKLRYVSISPDLVALAIFSMITVRLRANMITVRLRASMITVRLRVRHDHGALARQT